MLVLTVTDCDRCTVLVGVFSTIDLATSAMNEIRGTCGLDPLAFVETTAWCYGAWDEEDGGDQWHLQVAHLNQLAEGTVDQLSGSAF